ncbi:hypothetical protein E4U43_004999 [Claviceps pusilla]|uniref:Prp 4 CRoW domain-containing protein n=1 Tax=Claviceps pusilla TaxID=123648 RepID=A0A9P7N516_9HYPO|nr:hypothetical protein E4U43_004999 [Claviceps pusilla]
MLFQTIASLALLASSASAASAESNRKPYRLAVMAVPGKSLMRRDNGGYQPNQKHCKAGNTCAEACGAGFDQCPGGQADIAHCFNPGAGQSCCTDNSGNSCEPGFYCTHDDKMQTMCCPHDLDLAACAAAFHVPGLVAATAKPVPTTTSTTSSTTSTTTTSTTTSTSSTTSHVSTTSTTTSTTTATTAHNTTTSIASTTSHTPKLTTTTLPTTTFTAHNTTTVPKKTTSCTASMGNTTAWAGHNTTFTSFKPTQTSDTTPIGTSTPTPTKVNAAAASGVSALLLVAAGFIALL